MEANASSSPAPAARASPAQPRLPPDPVRCGRLARESSATGMPTMECPEGSLYFARCTKRWDTSTCITRCAPGRAAIRGLTTATSGEKLCRALRINFPVSVVLCTGWVGGWVGGSGRVVCYSVEQCNDKKIKSLSLSLSLIPACCVGLLLSVFRTCTHTAKRPRAAHRLTSIEWVGHLCWAPRMHARTHKHKHFGIAPHTHMVEKLKTLHESKHPKPTLKIENPSFHIFTRARGKTRKVDTRRAQFLRRRRCLSVSLISCCTCVCVT